MADSKITGLAEDTAPTSDDLVVVVNDPAGTPANKKVTLGNLAKGVGGAWTTFNTSLNQGGSVTFTQTYSKYTVIGKTCTYTFSLSPTAAGTTNNDIQVTLPFTTASSSAIGIGVFFWYSSAAARTYAGNALAVTTTQVGGLKHDSAPGSYFGKDPLQAIASGDVIVGTVIYEIT